MERLERSIAWESIADKLIDQQTIQQIKAKPEGSQEAAFLQAWCGLEPAWKADSRGIGADIIFNQRMDLHQWLLELPKGYAGSTALQQGNRQAVTP